VRQLGVTVGPNEALTFAVTLATGMAVWVGTVGEVPLPGPAISAGTVLAASACDVGSVLPEGGGGGGLSADAVS